MNDRNTLYLYLVSSYFVGGVVIAALKLAILTDEMSDFASDALRSRTNPTEEGVSLTEAVINIIIPFWASFELEDLTLLILYIVIGFVTILIVGSTLNLIRNQI